jgi:Aspartyl/Asparaginyl beta-hydroxylase
MDTSIALAVAVLIFISVIILVIFAPKSQNFFKLDKFKKLTDNEELIKETFIRLGIKLNEDGLKEEYEHINIPIKELIWRPWPDIKGVEYLPLYMFSKTSKEAHMFSKLFSEIAEIKDVQSVFFLKINSKFGLPKHNGWAELTNKTLRFIYCFNSFCYSEEECGIWINGESKKLFKDYHYIYDASKEHSIYNNTFDDIIFLIIDFDRPYDIPMGYSDNFLVHKPSIKLFE